MNHTDPAATHHQARTITLMYAELYRRVRHDHGFDSAINELLSLAVQKRPADDLATLFVAALALLADHEDARREAARNVVG